MTSLALNEYIALSKSSNVILLVTLAFHASSANSSLGRYLSYISFLRDGDGSCWKLGAQSWQFATVPRSMVWSHNFYNMNPSSSLVRLAEIYLRMNTLVVMLMYGSSIDFLASTNVN